MSEAKFTPGPWEFDKGYKFYHCISSAQGMSGYYFEVGKNSGSCYSKYDKEWMANALLISASPELYEAIRAALCDDPDWRQLAVDALAKAEGRTGKATN